MHAKGKCPECGRTDVAVTLDRLVWRHDHIARRRIVCDGVGRPALNILPRQLEIPAEQLRLIDVVDEAGRLVAFGVSDTREEVGEPVAEGLFAA